MSDKSYQNSYNYNKLQFFVIKWWGHLGHLNYDNLPLKGKSIKNIDFEVDKYLQAIHDQNDEEIEEYNEWLGEGAKMNGKAYLTKSEVCDLFHSCEQLLTNELVVYKTGIKEDLKEHRWLSVTMNKGVYHFMNGEEDTIILKKGTPVIYAHGIADDNELIVNSKWIK